MQHRGHGGADRLRLHHRPRLSRPPEAYKPRRNLSREWEEVAYGHPFSKRMIGNALLGYLLNQAWGNDPDAFGQELLDTVQASLNEPGGTAHDNCIDHLLRFDHWHYTWPTTPPLVVIDSRTHRWRSESAAREPSGLMDWESLTELQQTLLGLPAVLLVSPTPIFGVKRNHAGIDHSRTSIQVHR